MRPAFCGSFWAPPYLEALRDNRALTAALSAITAAVVGVMLNLALWFSLHVLFREVKEWSILGVGPDLPVLATLERRAAVLAAAALLAMLGFNVGMVLTLAGYGAAGLLLGLAGR